MMSKIVAEYKKKTHEIDKEVKEMNEENRNLFFVFFFTCEGSETNKVMKNKKFLR